MAASFSLDSAASVSSHLTEVTQILRISSTCDICGQSFPSHHALKVHKGKQHPELQPKHEPNPTVKNRRVDEYRRHAKGGLPQCRYCLKRFYGYGRSSWDISVRRHVLFCIGHDERIPRTHVQTLRQPRRTLHTPQLFQLLPMSPGQLLLMGRPRRGARIPMIIIWPLHAQTRHRCFIARLFKTLLENPMS